MPMQGLPLPVRRLLKPSASCLNYLNYTTTFLFSSDVNSKSIRVYKHSKNSRRTFARRKERTRRFTKTALCTKESQSHLRGQKGCGDVSSFPFVLVVNAVECYDSICVGYNMTFSGLCDGRPWDMAAPIHYPPYNCWGQWRDRCVVNWVGLVLKLLPKRRYQGAPSALVSCASADASSWRFRHVF